MTVSKAYHTLMSRNPMNNDLDFFETPRIATEELLKREEFIGNIYEPACGKGAISDVLKEASLGGNVFSSDIVDRGYEGAWVQNFLEYPREEDGRIAHIITNPPYKIAEEFIWHSLGIATYKVCMLLRLMFLESQGRYKLFTTTPLKAVYVFSYRLPFKAPEGIEWKSTGGMTPYAWFVWDKRWTEEPVIRWIQK